MHRPARTNLVSVPGEHLPGNCRYGVVSRDESGRNVVA